MSENKQYEVAVIGAGPGGYVAAIRAAQLGLRTALVEKRDRLGGTCLTIGCIPSKALLSSTELLVDIREKARLHGIVLETKKKHPGFDLSVMMERKEKIVEKLTSGVASLMKQNKVDVLTGEASVPEAGRVEVTPTAGGDMQAITAKHIVLATGSLPVELPFLPFNGSSIIDSTDALSPAGSTKRARRNRRRCNRARDGECVEQTRHAGDGRRAYGYGTSRLGPASRNGNEAGVEKTGNYG